ncbi:MAG: hypothetical protein RLZZ312_1434 [Bacteroidota bacterium]|jgi:2',3'-cyclic-nucleotide 2'-phosphodiesterase (5'-nucleotidase family)
MKNLKTKLLVLKQIVLFLTLFTIFSCSSTQFTVKKVVATKTTVNNNISNDTDIEAYIQPYRTRVDLEMNKILSIATDNIDKSGKWQTPIGNLFSDATLKEGNSIFEKRQGKKIDICLLNNGGFRANINKGNVTVRTAYEVMPFENKLVVVELSADVVEEMANFIILDKKPHPLAGMTFVIDRNQTAQNIMIHGKPLDKSQNYYVATNDYLANGGDKMDFFKKGASQFDLDYSLRNILIDYCTKNPTLAVPTDIRISEE